MVERGRGSLKSGVSAVRRGATDRTRAVEDNDAQAFRKRHGAHHLTFQS